MFVALIFISMATYFSLAYKRNMYMLPFYIFFTVSFWGVKLHAIGIPINIHHFMLALAALHVILNLRKITLNSISIFLIVFLMTLFLFGFVISFFNLSNIIDYGYSGTNYPPIRLILKNFEKIIYLIAFLLPWTFGNKYKFFEYSIIGYLSGIFFQSIASYYQLLSHFLGLPIWDYTSGSQQVILGFLRLNGLSGEPRHLGIYLAVGVALVLFAKPFLKFYLSEAKIKILLTILLINIILTFSTSGILLFTIFATFYLLTNLLNIKRLIIWFFAIATIFPFITSSQIYQDRISSRLVSDYIARSEYSSFSVFELIKDDPTFLISGTGTGLSPFFLRKTDLYKRAYTNSTDIEFSSIRESNGILIYVAEFGYLGIIILFFVFILLIFNLLKSKNDYNKMIYIFGILIFLTGIISYGPNSSIFYILFSLSCFTLNIKHNLSHDTSRQYSI